MDLTRVEELIELMRQSGVMQLSLELPDFKVSITRGPEGTEVVSAEQGTRIMADLIERRVDFRYVPTWPWILVAQALKVLPLSLLRRM